MLYDKFYNHNDFNSCIYHLFVIFEVQQNKKKIWFNGINLYFEKENMLQLLIAPSIINLKWALSLITAPPEQWNMSYGISGLYWFWHKINIHTCFFYHKFWKNGYQLELGTIHSGTLGYTQLWFYDINLLSFTISYHGLNEEICSWPFLSK